jgi:aspartate racemase
LFDLGGHSLLAARLAAHIGRAVGREVPLSAVFQAPTVAQFARLLRDQAGLMPDTLLVPREAAGAGPALFCIGCPAEFVRRLRNHLGSGRVCYALAPHGFDGRRAPSTVEQMGAEYVREIRSLQPDGPYYVAGFSFGGVAAFEVAQQLRAQEQEVGLVMLIDPTPLSGALPVAALAGAGLPDHMTAAGGSTGRLSRYVRRHWAELRRLKTAQRVRYTGRRLTRRLIWSIDHLLGQRSKRMLCDWYLDAGRRVPPALRKFYFMQASLQAARTYVPRPYSGPALLVVAAAHAGVQQRLWRPLVTGGIELHVVETDHFGILSQEHVERLAGWLGAYFHEV